MTGHRRVAVSSPQTRLARSGRRHRGHWRPSTLDPVQAERAIAVYHRQRRRALLAFGLLLALLLGMPGLLSMLGWLSNVRLLGIPADWLLLAVAPFPIMVALARWQLRGAERIEADEDGG